MIEIQETLITNEIDALIRTFEDANVNWFVAGGVVHADPFLLFETPKFIDPPAPARQAMRDFRSLFDSSVEIRKAVIDFAIAIGCFYIEFGNRNPVLNLGETRQ